MGGSSAQYLSCQVFRDWPIVNIWEINNVYLAGIYLLQFLKQHLTACVDLFTGMV